uniref:Uncharacterized protein n=1 Tax=Arundo donax TaxID=35708 RepID=A0A0A9FPK0_ARUDO
MDKGFAPKETRGLSPLLTSFTASKMLLRTVGCRKICRINFVPLSIICQKGKFLRSSTFQRLYSE